MSAALMAMQIGLIEQYTGNNHQYQLVKLPVSTVFGIDSIDAARSVVDEIKLPVVIKATAGGGGRGIRFITNDNDLESGLMAAITEASAAFGNDTVFIEKAADPGSRHVEVQILADTTGTVIALGERECSIQRHNQKLIEESGDDIPISDSTRRILRKAAVAAAKAAKYVNAGTVEFLVDKGGNPYFMEMNTRLQVEHIATEAVYPGLDLVIEQLKIAMGIPLDQELIAFSESFTTGRHSISVRITAENPNAGFSSQTGTIESLDIPNLGPNTPRAYFSFGQGGTVHSFADSQIGHVVVSAPTRESARQHMVAFLNKLQIKGILTTLQFSSTILQDAEYINGTGIHVNWLKQRLDDAQSKEGASLGGSKVQPELGLAAVAVLDYLFQKAESQDKFHANLISSRSIAPRLLANTGLTRVIRPMPHQVHQHTTGGHRPLPVGNLDIYVFECGQSGDRDLVADALAQLDEIGRAVRKRRQIARWTLLAWRESRPKFLGDRNPGDVGYPDRFRPGHVHSEHGDRVAGALGQEIHRLLGQICDHVVQAFA